tara:strand:- start:1680 stop:1895 length:216 start_codon:yes stop_codon:yes gene_type:complete
MKDLINKINKLEHKLNYLDKTFSALEKLVLDSIDDSHKSLKSQQYIIFEALDIQKKTLEALKKMDIKIVLQ